MSLGIPLNPWPVLDTTALVWAWSPHAKKCLGWGVLIFWPDLFPGQDHQRAACAGQKKQLLSQMETSIQNQKIQLSSLRTRLLNYRLHLQEGWTKLPSSHRKGRVVLVPEVPAATEEEWADPGECPEGTRGTALPLPRIPGLPKPKAPVSRSKCILSWEQGCCWPGSAACACAARPGTCCVRNGYGTNWWNYAQG